MHQYGLTDNSIALLVGVFSRHCEISEVIIYGSRAKGINSKFSDVDITLKGKCLSKQLLTSLIFEIDDLLLPYTFDISIYDNIGNPEVVSHIDRVGKVLYQKEVKNE